MKFLLPFFALLLFSLSFTSKEESTVLELQKDHKVILTINGNDESTHYLLPLVLTIKNISNKQQNVLIPPGLHFSSVDNGFQDIISTQSQSFVLAPGKEKKVPLKGMCIQGSNSSPNTSSSFVLKDYASSKLWELAKFLDEKDIQNSQGQHAMWVLSDNSDPSYIIGLDGNGERELLDKTMALADLPIMTDEAFKAYKTGAVDPEYKSSLKGSFTMSFSTGRQVQIAIFNEQNILIKEILNQWVEPGSRKVTYQLETTGLSGQKIYTQLIAGNKVWTRREINIPRSQH